jgi:putative protease
MANWQTPKSTGEKIGKVIAIKHNAIRVQLLPNITLHNGDGICYEDKGFAINRIEGDWIYPNNQISSLEGRSGGSLPKLGTTLYRNLDTDFLRSLKAERRIPVDIRFEATTVGYRLTIGQNSAAFEAEHQPASNPERSLQTIVQQLSKLGETDFIAQRITITANEKQCTNAFPYFIPISQLNQWRRETINDK